IEMLDKRNKGINSQRKVSKLEVKSRVSSIKAQ
ncbi:MAG: hypothetical protein RLZZ384_1326, partial [Pseudomonadota bacterium]